MTLQETLNYIPVALAFGTSGLRAPVTDMTDLECYINTTGFLRYIATIGQQRGMVIPVSGDLRDSTPRILGAVMKAIKDQGYQADYQGLIPTPAIAHYALQHDVPCIMVTGSHIPADRNGIKFYKSQGEVLKTDEAGIKQAVAEVRVELYAQSAQESLFDQAGMFKQPVDIGQASDAAARLYHSRYTDVYGPQSLAGKQIVFYQHSAVGRDLITSMLEAMGASVVVEGRSDVFIPIDSENVTPQNRAYFRQLAEKYPGNFAIISTDGDSDRPFVIDETGEFHRGDVLGTVVAQWCRADFAAYPVSVNDAVDSHLDSLGIPYKHTKIGSPYVIEAMQQAQANGARRAVGWEVNGGFLLGTDLGVGGGVINALPTRDAFFPILVALLSAVDAHTTVSHIFDALPQRYTSAGLINDFPGEIWAQIVSRYGAGDQAAVNDLARFFSAERGFDEVIKVDTLDGVRLTFQNGDIAHMRQSGNAPQLRIYSVAESQARADEIVRLAIAEPDGIFRKIEREVQQ